jgi:uncharacterized protein YecE (DUF72 family)
MRLRVGLTSLKGSIEEYARHFDLLELRADPQRLPSEKALRRLRASAGDRVEIALLVPAETMRRALETPAELAGTIALATAVDPGWIVFQTGSTVGPSSRVRTRLEALVSSLALPKRRVGWEPRGPFEADVAREWCNALGITLVEDLSQVDEAILSKSVYTRLRAEGAGARLAEGALEVLAERLAAAEEAYVVLEGRGSPKAKTRIRQAIESQLGLAARAVGADDDEADDDEVDDDEVDDDEADGDEADGDEADGDEADDDLEGEAEGDEASDEDDLEDGEPSR